MSDKGSYVALILAVVFVALSCATTEVSGPAPKTLVIGLDGVPYKTFKNLQDGGHFRNFQPVAPMVASFPSISDPNWSLLMGLAPEPGFTKAFFDPTIKTPTGFGMENGSIMAHLAREPKYEQVMDFKADGIGEHLSMFVWTDTTARYWLQSLEKKFFSFSGRDTYFALIINTDLISHTEGEQGLLKYLAVVEDSIERIQGEYRRRYGRDLEVILLSDHGNAYFEPQDIPYETGLTKMGWNLASTISGAKDVGFYVPEMLSFGAFYCKPESTRLLAQSLAKIDDIQSTMYEGRRGIHVFSDQGNSESLIQIDDVKREVFFQIVKGRDPFGHLKYFKNGKLSFDDYFQKTLQEEYPNALVRIWEGFHRNSQVRPQVLANAKLGYVFGNTALRLITKVRGFSSSHGSLHRDETLGIFTSTKTPVLPLRPQDARNYIHVNELEWRTSSR